MPVMPLPGAEDIPEAVYAVPVVALADVLEHHLVAPDHIGFGDSPRAVPDDPGGPRGADHVRPVQPA